MNNSLEDLTKVQCPACHGQQFTPWPHRRLELLFCKKCTLVFQPNTTSVSTADYSSDYYDYQGLDKFFEEVRRMKIRTSLSYLKLLRKELGWRGENFLDVGCAHGFTLEAAKVLGFRPFGVEVSPAADFAKSLGFDVYRGELTGAPFGIGFFDMVTLLDVIEHISQPIPFLKHLYSLLGDAGVLLMVTPEFASFSRRVTGDNWFHFKKEHVCYYSPSSMRALLSNAGFDLRSVKKGFKHLSLQYIEGHFTKYGNKHVANLIRLLGKILPIEAYTVPLKFPTGTIYIATKKRG